MNYSYFLGANSAKGFFSLYDGFCRRENDFLSVIKGGPGTGKSGFMRKIGREAERRGYDVEYVVCSGDTASLDGVYIPALHCGWTDGTAPHISDPKSFGVDGDYVNLGVFCKTPLSDKKRHSAELLFEGYRGHYARAYRYLNAAAALENASICEYSSKNIISLVNALYEIVSSKGKGNFDGTLNKRFYRCISGKGETVLSNELSKLCGEVYIINQSGFDSAVLDALSRKINRSGISAMICPSPVEPDKCDAVLLPQCGVGFVGSMFETDGAKTIDIPFKTGAHTEELKREQKAYAVAELEKAKSVHDELEEIFKSETDFDALTEYTERYIDGIFPDMRQ